MTEPMMIPLAQVKWDPAIYPRSKWNTATVERYAEAMVAGEEFPPLGLEEGTDRLLDGKHRQLAYEKAGITEVPVEWHVVPEDLGPKLYAASLSARHGDRVSLADLKDIIREEYAAWESYGREWSEERIAGLVGVSQQRVSEAVSGLVAKRRMTRQAHVVRLSMLGWTQTEIAKALDVDQGTVSRDMQSTDSGILHSGLDASDIALRLGWDLTLTTAKLAEGDDDDARLQRLDIKTQPYDVWQFPRCHDLMGNEHPGRIPGQLVCHLLYFFTDQGDLIVDPMAGSGTVLDACLLMGRKARGYDIDGRHNRVDVESHDLSDGWPMPTAKAKVVFWDPPYFDKMDDEYIEGSISGLDADGYLDWLHKRFGELREVVKPRTRLAFLMSDWDPENAKRHKEHRGLFIWDYADRLRDAGWRLTRHIQVPLSTQQIHPDFVNKHRAARRLGRLERWLLLAEA